MKLRVRQLPYDLERFISESSVSDAAFAVATYMGAKLKANPKDAGFAEELATFLGTKKPRWANLIADRLRAQKVRPESVPPIFRDLITEAVKAANE
jgi:hypothetical protein